MKSQLKQLTKDSIIYGIGGVIAKGIGFLLLPIFTRIFTPIEYGTIEMLVVLNSFLGILLTMGMRAAQSFYFFEQKSAGKETQRSMVTAILQWRLIWGSIIVISATFLSPLLNKFFFNGQLAMKYFAIAFIGALFAQVMHQSVDVFRLLYRSWKYIAVTLGNAVLSAIISITLVVWLNWGIIGYFVGFGIGSIFAAIFGCWGIRDYLDFSALHKNWWPKLLKFGVPLMPAGLAMYVLNTADRWFINYFHGQNALGMYAVGAKFSMFIALAVNAFRQAWWPVSMDALHSPDSSELFRTVARLYLGLGITFVVLLTSLSPLLMRWLCERSYYPAYPIIGILSWQAIFYGFYLIVVTGIWNKKKTFLVPITMTTVALINIALDAWLVPEFSVIGAGIATSISFLIWSIITIMISEKLWPVGYPRGVFILQIGIGILACWIILSLHQQNQALCNVGMVAIFASLALIGTLMKRNHFIVTYQYLKHQLFGEK